MRLSNRKTLAVLAALLLSVGCARQTPVASAPAPAVGVAFNLPAEGGANGDAPQAAPVDTPAVVAWRYEQQMAAPDPVVRMRAAEGLSRMGEVGYPVLVKGTQNANPDTRLSSLQSMPPGMLLQHKAETLPLVINLLRDENPRVRLGAIGRLLTFGKESQAALPELRRLATSDPAPEVRQTAGRTAGMIGEIATTGKIYAGAKQPDPVPQPKR